LPRDPPNEKTGRFGPFFFRFFSDVVDGRFRPTRPRPGKARSRSDHGAPANHRAESRPDIRLVGTVTGRRFATSKRWLESTGMAESRVAFPRRSPHGGFPEAPAFQRLGDEFFLAEGIPPTR